MKRAIAAFLVEWLKIKKSKTIWITSFVFLLTSVMMGILMIIIKHPELTDKIGIMSTKANLIGEANWPTMFLLLKQNFSVGGILGFGFITSWVFGSEYAERTLKDLLALPVSRTTIVLAKFAVIFLWCLILALLIFFMGIAVGMAIGLGELSLQAIASEFLRFEITALLLIILCAPVAFFANYGQGYMLPFGFIIVVIIIAQFVSTLGFASYFPWAIPALYLGAAGAENEHLSMLSFIILFLTSGVGVYLTLFWWNNVDKT